MIVLARAMVLALLISGMLSACGKKGELLPPPDHDAPPPAAMDR